MGGRCDTLILWSGRARLAPFEDFPLDDQKDAFGGMHDSISAFRFYSALQHLIAVTCGIFKLLSVPYPDSSPTIGY